jgi:hypothetical protein
MSDHSPRAILANLCSSLNKAFGDADVPSDEAVRALSQEVLRAAKALESEAGGVRQTRGRHGPAESPTAVEPPTFPGHKRRL